MFPITHLKKEDLQIDLSSFIYLQLITWESTTEGDKIFSYFDNVEEFIHTYSNLSYEEVDDVFDKLSKEGFIELVDDKILIAYKGKAGKILFLTKNETNYKAEELLLKVLYDKATSNTSSVIRKRSYEQAYKHSLDFLNMANNAFASFQFQLFFKELYLLCMTDNCRDFIGKEIGIIKTLFKNYTEYDLKRMLVKYFSSPDSYNKREVSLMSFYYAKDRLKQELTKTKRPTVGTYGEETKDRRRFK